MSSYANCGSVLQEGAIDFYERQPRGDDDDNNDNGGGFGSFVYNAAKAVLGMITLPNIQK